MSAPLKRSMLVVGALLALGGPASAGGPPPNQPRVEKREARWDPSWRHAGPLDYTVGSITTAALIVEAIILQPRKARLNWTDPILFDEDARKALRVTDPNAHEIVDVASWVMWLGQLGYPVLVDLPYAWARHGFPLARDLFWQDTITLTLAGAIDLGIRHAVGRARPQTYDCLQRGGGDTCLTGIEAARSFPGGHTLTGTAASVLTCMQHLKMKLYGGPWDAVTCAATLTSNTALVAMRVMTDNHWMTDQLVGVAIGAVIGFGVPWLLTYRGGGARNDSNGARPSALVLPTALPVDRGMGLGVIGIF